VLRAARVLLVRRSGFHPGFAGIVTPARHRWIASCSGESGRLKSGRARIVTGVIHFFEL